MNKGILFDGEAFDAALAAGAAPLPAFRDALRQAHEVLARRFEHGAPIVQLVRGRAWVMDQLLARAWRRIMGAAEGQAALVAVGGYGRGELHPQSDVDLTVLLPVGELPGLHETLECFLLFLWDMGLEVGHSVRSVADCEHEGQADITVATNLMESRLLAGDPGLYYAMRQVVGPDRIWPTRQFFEAKWQEQIARHHKFHDTAYNLEPNIKEGPGGLRDIQMIGWVAKRHFGGQTLDDLVGHGFLTPAEYRILIDGQNFLWRVRFGLHLLAKRREDRLLFDHQRALARQFGYKDENATLAVEQFMKRYYRTVMELGQLNEMLLQLFQEKILHADEPAQITPLNRRFQSRNGFLEVSHELVFRRQPFALLEIFLLLAQHESLKGIRAETIRLIRSHQHLIDDSFRDDLRCRSLFMELLRQPRGVYTALRRMNRYGILGAYLPSFGRIVGQMQHDLFHVYTVDQHILQVLRNLRRFTMSEFAHEYPLCSRIISELDRPWLLYIAALFHDIAKGRGGDHSELGTVDAREFCEQHGLDAEDTELVVWLVKNHLVMSQVAQKEDLGDPEVIGAFARLVGDGRHLAALYLLTHADIRGTSPKVWNQWKGKLLADLYFQTLHYLHQGETPAAHGVIAERQAEAMRLLRYFALSDTVHERLWKQLDTVYFLRHSAEEIAWHTRSLHYRIYNNQPVVRARLHQDGDSLQVMVYTQDQPDLFARIVGFFARNGYSIVDAKIHTTAHGYALDSFVVLDIMERDNNREMVTYIEHELEQRLIQQLPPEVPSAGRLSRQVKHFPIKPEAAIVEDERGGNFVLSLVAADRPGLLYTVADILAHHRANLQTAKITTLGERAEDVFLISGGDLRESVSRIRLETELMERLKV